MASKKMNHTTSSDKLGFNNHGNNMNNFKTTYNMNKKKGVSVHEKFKQKPSIIYEENYQSHGNLHGNSGTKIVPLKFQGSKVNANLKNLYTKDFQLPSINGKNLSKKIK